MLGIGFGEMVLIAGVALVVIGPEKFPDFAKLVIRTVRDLRGYVDDMKTEVTRELKPLKKEMDSLSRIDPEKYIDSLTKGDDDKKPTTPTNPSINEEDRKVMAAGETENYSDDPYGWEGESQGGYGVEKSDCPQDTVGYGDTGTSEEDGDGDDAGSDAHAELAEDGEVDSETEREENTTAPSVPEAARDSAGSDAQGVEEASEFVVADDDRIEMVNPDGPDVWTGR